MSTNAQRRREARRVWKIIRRGSQGWLNSRQAVAVGSDPKRGHTAHRVAMERNQERMGLVRR